MSAIRAAAPMIDAAHPNGSPSHSSSGTSAVTSSSVTRADRTLASVLHERPLAFDRVRVKRRANGILPRDIGGLILARIRERVRLSERAIRDLHERAMPLR